MKSYANFLHRCATQLGLTLTSSQVQQLLAYVIFLDKWNKHYNLSAIRNIEDMLTHHILDSLAVVPYLQDCSRVLDVGTGAGLPGVVLAITYPQHHFVLLDSNGKKIRFLLQAKHELEMTNIEPIWERAENYRTSNCFDGIISRAVGPLNELIDHTKHLLCPGRHWYAMKGNYPEAQLKELAHQYRVECLDVPELNETRHLVIIEG